ncbi:MAG: hypothetical protein JWM78_425 [Verrucomicrobiaceae bacterium]|nr:hypothetical protein [Verrucomicrobiaceae bacterium]
MKKITHRYLFKALWLPAIVSTTLLMVQPAQGARSMQTDLAGSYRFLVTERDSTGGALYTATAGKLAGLRLPLSFVDTPAYWGDYVCHLQGNDCTVLDIYNAQTYALTPQKSAAGDLQTERVNTHNGTNIYDAATWQIAVMLGHASTRLPLPNNQDAYALISNQNLLLREGYNGNASHPAANQNRATTAGNVFIYNRQVISDPQQAFTFRTVARDWLSTDPLFGSPYAAWITAKDLPALNSAYQPGKVTWTDWKPITGENAWAFLIGPLQAAYIHHVIEKKSDFVPYQDLAVQNALAILPTFAAMQSALGAVYYAPAGTVRNQGDELVNPHEVAVENNFSLYAGLKILHATLTAELAHDIKLTGVDRAAINDVLHLINTMINGGKLAPNRSTAGLLYFFKNAAWQNGEFVQGGLANDPAGKSPWIASTATKAVDVNTWGIAVLGAQQIDAWFGFGAAYKNWQQLKAWGGYGLEKTLWGVGYSNVDGNGIDATQHYRQGIMSAEWTAGAINMLRSMLAYYQTIPQSSPHYAETKKYIASITSDEQSMLIGVQNLRADNYLKTNFPDKPSNYNQLNIASPYSFLYASKRYLIPFGWFANPLPSVCSTAWIVMLESRYDPFQYGGMLE